VYSLFVSIPLWCLPDYNSLFVSPHFVMSSGLLFLVCFHSFGCLPLPDYSYLLVSTPFLMSLGLFFIACLHPFCDVSRIIIPCLFQYFACQIHNHFVTCQIFSFSSAPGHIN
jgi:hypothetical protein